MGAQVRRRHTRLGVSAAANPPPTFPSKLERAERRRGVRAAAAAARVRPVGEPEVHTAADTMSKSAEAVAGNQTSSRNVTIEITNNTGSFWLVDPKIYLKSGNCHAPPQPTIGPAKTEVCNFSKQSGKTTGAVGVLTFDTLSAVKQRVAIMFSVPFDYNVYENWLAVGIYGPDRECDEKLYKEMYNDKPERFSRSKGNGCCLTWEGAQLDIKATMSPMGRCIMKVEIWDKVFS